MLGLERDGVRELLCGDLGQRHALHDALAPRHRDRRGGVRDACLLHALADGVAHEARLLDAALANHVAGKGDLGEGLEGIARLALHQLDRLDGAGADIEPEREWLLSQPKKRHVQLPSCWPPTLPGAATTDCGLACSAVKDSDYQVAYMLGRGKCQRFDATMERGRNARPPRPIGEIRPNWAIRGKTQA